MNKEKETVTLNQNGRSLSFLFSEHDGKITLERYLTYDVGSVLIPASLNGKPVVGIGADCFLNHTEIKNVSFPDSLTSIGVQAFALCSGIRELDLPDSIEDIEFYAFRDCKSLERVKLPAKLKRIKRGLFSFCHLYEDAEIILPDGLETIDGGAFWSAGCFNMRIPDSVREIGVGAFNWGPSVQTSLPYDKGWYQSWPYGEKVIDKTGAEYVITDVYNLPASGGCMVLSIDSDASSQKLFYPFVSGEYSFADPKNKKQMEKDLTKNPDVQQTYIAWLRGLI
ncbi:MAG: leucine-rich repeat domain-containing protein [Oscillospiraceae bacterium]|nr:leucine-rich repeat domain-containing protein [Oscillospiraceae bacterium]